MRNETRTLYRAYLDAIAQFNGVQSAVESFVVNPSVAIGDDGRMTAEAPGDVRTPPTPGTLPVAWLWTSATARGVQNLFQGWRWRPGRTGCCIDAPVRRSAIEREVRNLLCAALQNNFQDTGGPPVTPPCRTPPHGLGPWTRGLGPRRH